MTLSPFRVAILRVLVGGVKSSCVPVVPTHRTPQGSYLVDPASSHMLVSKIKPCMSKYKLLIL